MNLFNEEIRNYKDRIVSGGINYGSTNYRKNKESKKRGSDCI